MSKTITKESEVLLLLLAKGLFGYEYEINFDGVCLKDLYNEAKAQTVVGLAFDSLPKSAKDMDEEVYASWQQAAFWIVKRTFDNTFANVQMTNLLQKANIPHSTLKGYSSAYYYPKAGIRQMGDIDFYIDKSNQNKTIALLESNGFVRQDHDEHPFHIAFSKNKMWYELHTAVTSFSEDKAYIFDEFNDLIDKSVEVDSDCGKIVIPSKYHHGITMLLHMQRHMVEGSGIGLRHLCDWAVFVNSIDNAEWIDIFENRLKKIGLWKFAKAISKTSSYYLKMPEKQWFADVDDELATALIFDIFDGGNFGRKNETRGMQRVMNTEGSQNKVIRFLRGTKAWVYNKYPICSKYKIIFPLIYIGHSFKIIFKIIFKRANYRLSDVVKDGEARYNVYDALCIFQKEK